VLTVHDVPNI
jgi:CTP synthase